MQETGFAASCLRFLRHLWRKTGIKNESAEKEEEITINFHKFRASEVRLRRAKRAQVSINF
jgi:hypothetical protein